MNNRNRKNTFALAVLALVATLAGCKSGNNASPGQDSAAGEATGTYVPRPASPVSLEIRHTVGNQPLALGSEHKLEGNTRITLNRVGYILSNVVMIKDDGSELPLAGFAQIVSPPANGATTLNLTGDVPAGKYKGLRFSIGLDSATNHQDPTRLPQGHPLNNPDMHWSWMPDAGYKFMAVEGRFQFGNSTAARDTGAITYHLATNPLFTAIHVLENNAFEVKAGVPVTLPVVLDLAKLFNGIDLRTEGITESMTAPKVALAKRLAANWPAMFSKP